MNLPDEQRDAMLIDRLVDGELSGDERRQLLAKLEAEPNGWRRCALAFIEAQTWRSALGGFADDAIANENAAAQKNLAANATENVSSVNNSHFNWGTWLAVAASVVVAFGLGRQSGAMRSERISVDRQMASTPADPSPRDNAIAAPATRHGDAVTLVVNDRAGVPQRIEVPLVEGRELGGAFGDVPHWSSPELDRQLDERGLDLTARRRYAPIYFEQENKIVPMVVPVDDAIVRPAMRKVY